jgi:glycosyltransferase involved in cell wall biosynthesis
VLTTVPKISVLIPAYNAKTTIVETIASVLAQTWEDLEVLVGDDGSQDDTVAILRSEYTDPRLHIHCFTHQGVQATRNQLIALSIGDYIAFLDADDLWTPEKLEKQYQAIKAHPTATIAYSWTQYIDEANQRLPIHCRSSFEGNVHLPLLLSDFIGNGSNPLVDRSAMIAVGGFDETFAAAQDWDLWIRLAARYEFAVVPETQILYRQYTETGSISSNVLRHEKFSRQIVEREVAKFPTRLTRYCRGILANRYKGFTWKSLFGYPTRRRRGWIAARFMSLAIYYDPQLLKKEFVPALMLKIVLWSIFSGQRVYRWMHRFPVLLDVQRQLLNEIKVFPEQVIFDKQKN